MTKTVTVNESVSDVTVSGIVRNIIVTDSGTVGPQGASGEIIEFVANASDIAVDSSGNSQTATATITTRAGHQPHLAKYDLNLGIPTGKSGVIQSIAVSTVSGSIPTGLTINSGTSSTFNQATNSLTFSVDGGTLWNKIYTDVVGSSNNTSKLLAVSADASGLPSQNIFINETINFTGTTNEIDVTRSGRTFTFGLPAEPVVSGITAGNIQIGVGTNNNKIYSTSGLIEIDTNGSSVQINDDLVLISNVLFNGAIEHTSGTVTLSGNAHVNTNLTVGGNLTVSGTTTTVNTETINLADNIILLNSNATGSASENAGIEIERGSDTNVSFIWDETYNRWDAGSNTVKASFFMGNVIGAVSGNAGSVTDGVYLSTTQTITGAKTFSSVITASAGVAGNLTGTVTATSVLASGVTATTQSAGDNSTKVATTAYVDTLVTAQDLDLAGDSGTGAVDLDSQTLTIAGTSNEIETSATNQTITIGLPSTINVNLTGNTTGTVTASSILANGVTATTQSAGDNSTKVATTAYVDSIVTAQDLDFTGDSGTSSIDLDSQTMSLLGTANQITTAVSGQTVTFSLPSVVHRDIQGDLTGNVTATSVLADGVTATTQSAGNNTTKVATTAYADTNFDPIGSAVSMAIALG